MPEVKRMQQAFMLNASHFEQGIDAWQKGHFQNLALASAGIRV
jgi:hypothetical protein